ncbi:sn-glycerol-3-phosphate ABC transporter ATP-binding protein UgpC [Saccharopolyspora taberi]|uniref:Sn-glycerol-3-phosphate ABC transporter ATP-binding protein UgpC n=1 Tax=Saccharopolyspora taberi TaxID=60895 RepID=A0ABN3VIX3_9PSEU
MDSVSLDISHGEFVVLLGPSGCGKSTLLRMIAGLLPPSAGRILLDDRDITHVAPKDRDLAMVFQSYALYPHLTVARNLGFPLRTRGWSRADIHTKVAEVASLLGLGELLQRRPKELSGGQRQRVALGRALVRDPGAFLMDEPLSNLDAKLRTATRTELTALHKQLGSTFVYVTHDQVEAMTMATRIAVLNQGRLEQAGTPSEVYDTPESVFVAGFMGSPPMNLIDARVESRAGRVHVTAHDIDVPLDHPAGDFPTRDVVLGVRPEHLTIVGRHAPDGPQFRGVVEAVENLGNEEVAVCSAGGARLVARGQRPLGLHVGEHVTFTTSPDRTHLFDPATGRRLVWRDPQPEVAVVPRELDAPAV